MPLSSWFRVPFISKRVRRSQTLLELPLQQFHPTFPLMQDKLSWKTSLLVRSEILRLFGKTLTADHIYSVHRGEKLRQKAQRLLSQKPSTFSRNFISFSESTQNFAHFQKKRSASQLDILEVIDPDKCGYFNGRKLLFQNILRQ